MLGGDSKRALLAMMRRGPVHLRLAHAHDPAGAVDAVGGGARKEMGGYMGISSCVCVCVCMLLVATTYSVVTTSHHILFLSILLCCARADTEDNYDELLRALHLQFEKQPILNVEIRERN